MVYKTAYVTLCYYSMIVVNLGFPCLYNAFYMFVKVLGSTKKRRTGCGHHPLVIVIIIIIIKGECVDCVRLVVQTLAASYFRGGGCARACMILLRAR